MTIEEKSKRYDEALERAKSWLENRCMPSDTNRQGVLEDIFPELKESEDERIRKGLINYFNHHKNGINIFYGIKGDDILAWLEKQGESYTKRDVDDAWLKGMCDAKQELEKQGEMDIESYKAAEDEKREFVGDGFIKCYADFQDFKEGETYWLEYVSNDNYNVRSDNLLGKTYHITPCQLYTVFKKMTWLEKQEYEQKNKINSYKITFEDVLVLECAIKTIKITEGGNKLYEKLVPFYDKIHNAYLLEKKQGEQKVSYTTIVETGNGGINAFVTRELPTNGCYEQKPAWTKEDERKIQDCIDAVSHVNLFKVYYQNELVGWLKSLKDRVQPQNTWKPSDEQMQVLHWCMPLWFEPKPKAILESLINDLKKLREE